MKIELLESLLTGHEGIDGEHRQIVDAINQVSKVIDDGEFDKCPDLLDNFLNICANHFESEEKLLAELGYPDLQQHIVFHRELTLKAKAVRVLCMDFDAPQSIRRCFDEMSALLIEDVVKGDMAFVSFLIDKGVASSRLHVGLFEKLNFPKDKIA
ncbi:MAG: hypothetical protein COB46_08460 [Rhodospirillaceae bacterium]|nr:MAG: hypothetical protein COB46_08460 [Rhodospirillaceae bacterium]